ncbi:helix-turn-helix domain-containing protein [Bifidobacterium aerophilum]|uniref:Helix-turn-helix domain-containing protein n=1 Tax=Bifidobacterium aerophilum TaxID=1798155 RepID=A0A6N9Z888_9BIFI|nr:helix-turn-helix domain-containing protein [Bifidobacterium aerophilum]
MTLRDMRDSRGDSIRLLAHRADVPPQSITRWESGDRDPHRMRLDTACRLATALGLSLDDFWANL